MLFLISTFSNEEIGGTEELEVVTITPPPDLEPLELSFSEEDKGIGACTSY